MCKKYKAWLLATVALLISVCLIPGCGPPKNTFQKYDFRFDYRADIEATSEKGSATIGQLFWVPDIKTWFWLDWYEVSEQPEDVKSLMEESVQGSSQATKAWAEAFVLDIEGRLRRAGGVGVDWAITGQPTAEVIGGYEVSHQLVCSQPGSGVQGTGICAVWYCADIDKLFVLQIVASDPLKALKEVRGFLKGFDTKPS